MILKPTAIGAKFHKGAPKKWPFPGYKEGHKVLYISTNKEEMRTPPHVDIHSWSLVGPDTTKFQFPSDFYDFVVLNRVLEEHGKEQRQKIKKECFRLLKLGGILSSISVACDDAKEIYDITEKNLAIDDEKFVKKRLFDKDIASLRPQDLAFFSSSTVIPSRKRLVKYIESLGIEGAKLEHLFGVPEKVVVKRLLVGMKWQK